VLLALGCGSPQTQYGDSHSGPDASEPRLITSKGQLEGAVGSLITVRGPVTNSKVPTILGVDVRSDDPDLRGQTAQATGVLERRVVTQAELERRIAIEGQVAHRGAGTFYSVRDEDGQLAAVVPVPGTSNGSK
jgi:hypothetical protein